MRTPLFLPVTDRVLQRQHHLLGSSVSVERYNEMDPDGIVDVSLVQDTQLQREFELTDSIIDPLIIKCLSRDFTCLLEDLKQLDLKMEIKLPNGITVSSTKPIKSERLEACKKLVLDLINNNFAANHAGVPERSLPEMLELLCKFTEENLFEFKLLSKSTVLHTAGSKDAMAHFNVSRKEIMDKHIHTQATHELSHSEYEFTTQVTMEQLKAAFPNVNIKTLQGEDGYGLQLAGSISDLEAFDKCLAELKCPSCVEIHLPTSIIDYFKTSEGFSKLKLHVTNKSVQVGVCFLYGRGEKLKLQFLCKPSDVKLTQNIVSELTRIVADIKIPLSESFLFVRNELSDFQSLCNSLQSERSVQIVPGETAITIAGFKDDLDHCAQILTDYIKAKSRLRVDIPIPKGMWKLFDTYMKGPLDVLTTKSKELNIEFTLNTDVLPPCVTLCGERVHVDAIASTLAQLKSSVQKSVIDVDRPGICDLFTSEKGRLYMDGIESRAKVAIDVAVDGEEDPTDSSVESTGVDVQVECTASVNRVQIDICIGDITEYSTDVIVNAANEDLQHSGGVAWAIANKGGSVIEEDSTQHVRRSGKVDSGDSWLTTKTGHLPCKALVHAVGPRWTGSRKQKEVALLYKACKTSLEKSHKYRSITFPAISSGIYGFPIELCADTMVRAAIEFSNRKPTSALQKVTFILHPNHAKQAIPFVASLKKYLPADSVYSTSQVSSVPSRPPVYNRKEAARKPIATSAASAVTCGKVDLQQGGLMDVEVQLFIDYF